MLTKVTITGADDNTNINDLIALSKKYPFVEWGILFSPSRLGEEKYPSIKWVMEFLRDTNSHKLNTSAHLCGGFTAEMLTKGTTRLLFERFSTGFFDWFGRYQLNFNSTKHIVNNEFYSLLRKMNTKKIIFQYNSANHNICNSLMAMSKMYSTLNFHYLYDSSGGRGIMPIEYDTVIPNHYTGYSGGLSPDNIEEALVKIKKASQKDDSHDIWVDTETMVRTDGKLDLVKVERFLEICSKEVNNN